MVSIPIYIRLMGIDEWGVAAACVSLQLIANFVDAGFSQIVPRWVAKESSNYLVLRRYVKTFVYIYFCLGLSLFFILQASASYLAQQWFQVGVDRAEALELAIRIVSFQIFFQFINNVNLGYWYGLQRQVIANVRTCFFGTLKHFLAIGILWSLSTPHAWVYTLIFAVVAFFEFFSNALILRRDMLFAVPHDASKIIPVKIFFKEVSLLSGGIFFGLLASHLDRIVLSRTLKIEDFGVYTVVIALALAVLQLQAPFTRSFFPLFVHDIQAAGWVSKANFNRLILGTVAVATAPALIASLLASDILQLWLHDLHIVKLAAPVLRLLFIAIALNTLYNCVYQVIVAAGKSHLILKFNVISLGVSALVAASFGAQMGLLLGGVIWIAATSTQLILGMTWFFLQKKYFLTQRFRQNSGSSS